MSVKVCIPVLKELPEKEPKHRMNREERANGLVSLFIQQKQKQEINVRSITISTLRLSNPHHAGAGRLNG